VSSADVGALRAGLPEHQTDCGFWSDCTGVRVVLPKPCWKLLVNDTRACGDAEPMIISILKRMQVSYTCRKCFPEASLLSEADGCRRRHVLRLNRIVRSLSRLPSLSALPKSAASIAPSRVAVLLIACLGKFRRRDEIDEERSTGWICARPCWTGAKAGSRHEGGQRPLVHVHLASNICRRRSRHLWTLPALQSEEEVGFLFQF